MLLENKKEIQEIYTCRGSKRWKVVAIGGPPAPRRLSTSTPIVLYFVIFLFTSTVPSAYLQAW